MNRVLIRGDGIAACCCEHLLRRAGFEVWSEPSERPRLPAIMLSDAAVGLIRDVFDTKDLFSDKHGIARRVVAWGHDAEPVKLAHSAIVVSEQELLDAVHAAPPKQNPWQNPGNNTDDHADWTVITSRPLPAGTTEHGFGARTAHAIPVTLRAQADTCWIESLEEGWLFLIPNRDAGGWLLSVGSTPEALLTQSRVVAKQIAQRLPATGEFAASPRIVTPLSGVDWVACGTAAMAFDPLCGDGTANAVREAILASALIGAACKGGNPEDLAQHYQARLTAGFARHLALSLNFYQTGGSGEWWQREAASLQDGLRWCAQQNEGFAGYRYQLQGFELTPVLR